MASNPNADFYARDGVRTNDPSFFHGDGFASYNSGYGNGQDQQQWNYPAGHLSDAPLYRGWNDAPHNQGASSAIPHDGHNDFYTSHFASNPSNVGAARHHVSDTIASHGQSPYEQAINPQAALSSQAYAMHGAPYGSSNMQNETIAPGALQSNGLLNSPVTQARQPKVTLKINPKCEAPRPVVNSQQQSSSTPTLQSTPVVFQVPKGIASGNFVIQTPEALKEISNLAQLHNFLHIGQNAIDLPINKSTIPSYFPRKSRNELKRLVGGDSKLAGKVAKKPSKRGKSASSKPVSSVDTTKPGQRPSHSPSEETSSEEDSSGESSDEELAPQPPLPAVRPSTPKEAIKYDTIKSLWRSQTKSLSSDDIRKGLADYWAVVQTIRDRWKSDTEAVREAEAANKMNEVPLLQERVANQRDMLEIALKVAIEHGHREILEHLGLNLPLMAALGQFVTDRARNTDYNGPLTRKLLELLSIVNTLTEANFEKVFGKSFPRFSKRGDEHTIRLAKKAIENANAASKKKKESIKSPTTTSVATKETKAVPSDPSQKAGSPTTGAKRVRPTDKTSEQPSKRVTTETSKSIAASNGLSRPEQPVKQSSTASESRQKTAQGTTASVQTKVKTNPPLSKPSGFFSALQPAKKPTATASVNNTTKQPSTTEKPPPPPAASKAPAFSLSQVMASIEKPKEAEKPASSSTEAAPGESPDEKAKRLRKEERRKLRVSFKPDSQLVDIRYFRHAPEEDLGHDENQMRDVGDLESEGRMFKLKHQEDAMDIDEDDDEPDESTAEIFNRQYPSLVPIDFSTLSDDDRNQNYETRGGELKPDCPERWLQEQREQETLLVVYSQSSDIPPNPKEPPMDSAESTNPPKMFGQPAERILMRLEEVRRAEQAAGTPNMPITASNISSILSAMKSEPAQFPNIAQSSHPSTQTTAPHAPPQDSKTTELEQIFAKFAAPSHQQQQPTPVPTMGGLFGSQTLQSQFNNNQPYQPPQQPPASNMANLSSLLASLQSGHIAPIPPPIPSVANIPSSSFPQPPSIPDLSQQGYSQPQQQNTPPNGHPYENEERRRLREWEENEENQKSSGKFNKNKRPWVKGKTDERGLPFKVVQCKYWTKGKCTKGEACTFLQ